MNISKNNKKVLLIAAVMIVVIVVILFNNKSVETVEIISSRYEDKVNFKGFYFVDETVVSGVGINKNNLNYKEGDLVPKGGKITDIISAPVAGMMIAKIDGYEGKYNLQNIKNINLKEISQMISDKTQRAGIKIVNNSEWFVCTEVDKEDFKSFKKGMARDLFISGKYYSGEVMRIFSNNKENYLVFKIKNDINISRLKRGFEGFIVKARYDGFIIPQKAIIEYNGDKGVFVDINGYAHFRKTKVLAIDGNEAVIVPAERGAKVKDYDDVICSPKGIVEGSRVN